MMKMATWNAEILQMINSLNVAAEKVSEKKNIYISIYATENGVNITVYPMENEEEEE